MPKGVYPRASIPTRFERMVDRSGGPDACHPWIGGISSNTGYGNFSIKHKTYAAHRIGWELANGPIPIGLILRHKCRMRHCVNTRHLETGTFSDNNGADMIRDGTRKTRFDSPRTKLTREQALEARRLLALGVTWTRLGLDYGCDPGAIRHAISWLEDV